MTETNSQVFYSGGYFLIRAAHPGWQQLQSELIPNKIISLSSCISQHFNVNWGWATGNKQLALNFGIPEEKLDEFVSWCQEDYRELMDLWNMFHTPDTARQFIRRFKLNTTDLHIIGAALPQSFEQKYWQATNNDVYGIEKRIEQHLCVVSGGSHIGFDFISFEYGEFGHSWLCHHLHEDIHRLFGIRPNQYGLFENYQDATIIFDWIETGEDEGRAHHPPYDIWQLLTYPLEIPTST